MYRIIIQRMADFQVKSRDFATYEAANTKMIEGINKAHKVIADDHFNTCQPLKRSIKIANKAGAIYVMNLYKDA